MEQFITHEPTLQLINEVIDVWQHGLLGIDIGRILGALFIFIGVMLFRGVFTKYVLNRLHVWASKTTNKADDKVIEALLPPVRFIPVILAIFFAGQYAEIDQEFPNLFTQLIRTLIVFTMFWGFHRTAEPLSHLTSNIEKVLSQTMVEWLVKFVKVLFIFLGFAIILEIWGIKVGPLLAGLGLFGAAVALGAQDVFKNLIGGVTLIAEKKFHPGDWIKIDGVVEGTVDSIGFRSTQVRRFDKAPVQVPNSILSDAAITNFSRMTHRRIYWKLGVEYRTTIDQLKIIRDGILEYIMNSDDFAKPPEVSTFVRIDSFNDSSIDIMLYCFTKTTNWGEWLEIKENFAFFIKDLVEVKAGAGFAFPSQSIYLESLPEGKPELFNPPAQ